LKGTSPQISFTFVDDEMRGNVNRDDLLKVLSQGEKRALYILNLLFEITSRQKLGGTTLLIVDDIADSFDYKNKYAIVEYLKEISSSPSFCSIFLTHNFDFHRTIALRLNIYRTHRLFAVKRERCLTLVQEVYQKDPFAHWKSNLTNPKYTISAIPFVRNLADYCDKGGHDFSTLTCFLHLKPESTTLTVKDLQKTFLSLLKDQKTLVLPEQNKLVLDLIFETANTILQEDDQQAELESKIVLSIAIRLKAEEVMIRRIADDSFVNSIKENQTITLLTKFRENFPHESALINILERVNLITPENIHLNSFMYEPILDMGTHHLKSMYREISELQ
jgi:energy-coupling factor transporter ATP-binding protein EcfA2